MPEHETASSPAPDDPSVPGKPIRASAFVVRTIRPSPQNPKPETNGGGGGGDRDRS